MLVRNTSILKLDSIHKVIEHAPVYNDGLFGGVLGLILYYYHYAEITGDLGTRQKADELIADLFERVNHGSPRFIGHTLSAGTTGFAYIVQYLNKQGVLELNFKDEFNELDDQLFSFAIADIDEDKIDYMHGAMGIFLYFISGDLTIERVRKINGLFDKLVTKVVFTKDGAHFVNLGLERLTVQHRDLSLAHGLSGILLLILKAYPVLNDKATANKIIEEGIRFIMAYELPIRFPDSEFSIFPCSFRVDTIEIDRFNRLAWCYGDLNIVLLLYRAATILKIDGYKILADNIGAKTVLRSDYVSTMVNDTHFCHGSSGLVQFYDTLFRESGVSIYAEAREFWYKITLELALSELASGRYSKNPISLLEGWVGVALVLLSRENIRETKWQGLFLL